MPTLSGYKQFAGRHWETGSIYNFFAHRGFTAPHTGAPYSEAFMLGVSGGITVGYFKFAYEGYDPQCNILTRNTFDPLDTLLSRLGVIQNREQTGSAGRAEAILVATLQEGLPAIVWTDAWSLPYNGFEADEGMWGSFPLIVYGYEPEQETVMIADRASVPLTVTPAELAAARGRIKKDKYRLLTLEAPDEKKLVPAVQMGIYDIIRHFTEPPPRGTPNNFGLKALQFWAQMLRQPKHRQSWEKWFPAGQSMYAGLTSAFYFAFIFGKGTALDAERALYASFLEEAVVLLSRPALRAAAESFRASGAAWGQLPAALLPDSVAPFREARELMWRRHRLFLEEGGAALPAMQEIDGRLVALRDAMRDDFPLNPAQVVAHREEIADRLDAIHNAEQAAVELLQAAMA
jgi:hypothetical protein